MTPRQATAFALRLEGLTYAQIAAQTGWSELSLRKYFSSKGKWYDEYQSWSSTESARIKHQYHTRILSRATYALDVIDKAMRSDNLNIALKAAEDILDRAGLQKSSRVWDKSKSTDDIAERIVQRYERR